MSHKATYKTYNTAGKNNLSQVDDAQTAGQGAEMADFS
jgi:hypothetical protein